MTRTGLILLLIGCLLPVLAVVALRRTTAAAAPDQALPALPTAPGGGLVLRDREQVLRPALLLDSYPFSFPYRNAGDRPLTISGATTSCGCASIAFLPPTLQPGQWGLAQVLVGTRQRFGPVEATVTVHHDAGADAVFTARVELPPPPKPARDELVIPAGSAEASLPIRGGDARFRLQLLAGPASSRPAITARVEPAEDGLRLVCAMAGERPAAARITLRVGYGGSQAADLTIRVVAE